MQYQSKDIKLEKGAFRTFSISFPVLFSALEANSDQSAVDTTTGEVAALVSLVLLSS